MHGVTGAHGAHSVAPLKGDALVASRQDQQPSLSMPLSETSTCRDLGPIESDSIFKNPHTGDKVSLDQCG